MKENTAMMVSKFSSLNFTEDWIHDFEVETCYTQRFSREDVLSVQAAVYNPLSEDKDGLKIPTYFGFLLLRDERTEQENHIRPMFEKRISDTHDVYHWQLPYLEHGDYTVSLQRQYLPSLTMETIKQAKFAIVDDSELTNTVRVSSAHRRNEFDTIFVYEDPEVVDPETVKLVFEFRVEGGAKHRDKQFVNEGEDFRDQNEQLRLLNNRPRTIETFTFGSDGLPYWVGDKLNVILSSSDVKVDEVPYVRPAGAKIETEELTDTYPKYVYRVDMERIGSIFASEQNNTGQKRWIIQEAHWLNDATWLRRSPWGE